MNLLLIRSHPGNERFGLGPFFRVEPLGLEYVASAARRVGAVVTLVDERFERLGARVARSRPSVVARSKVASAPSCESESGGHDRLRYGNSAGIPTVGPCSVPASFW